MKRKSEKKTLKGYCPSQEWHKSSAAVCLSQQVFILIFPKTGTQTPLMIGTTLYQYDEIQPAWELKGESSIACLAGKAFDSVIALKILRQAPDAWAVPEGSSQQNCATETFHSTPLLSFRATGNSGTKTSLGAGIETKPTEGNPVILRLMRTPSAKCCAYSPCRFCTAVLLSADSTSSWPTSCFS